VSESETNRPVIVALGEILWDCFPSGPRFGGAPANFAQAAARRLQGMADVHLVSAVGHDALGDRALAQLQQAGVGTDHVQTNPWPTGQVSVSLDAAGIATYQFGENQAWDYLTWTPGLVRLAQASQVVCFGTLGQRSEASRIVIERFVSAAKNAWRVLDINIREPYFSIPIGLSSLQIANVVKLNEEELPQVAAMVGVADSAREMAKQIRQRLQLAYLAVTRGPHGAWLLSEEGFSEVAAPPVADPNTVGAGDAFTAALVEGLLRGDSLASINEHAVAVASEACRSR